MRLLARGAGRRDVARARAVGCLVVLVLSFAVLDLAGRPAGGGGSPVTGLERIESLPLSAQSVISATMAETQPGFAATRDGAGWRLHGGGVTADFGVGAVAVSTSGGSAALELTGAGRGSRLRSPALVSLGANGNRVMYDRGWVREWYAAGPLGIEQGFTIEHRALGAGLLSLALELGGSLRPARSGSEVQMLTRRGEVAMRYGGLVAVDASGHRLPATLKLRGRRLWLQVDDRSARYPVRIDPLLQQGVKLTPNVVAGNPGFGDSVALSSDGNTALVGGMNYNSFQGGAWVFTRTNGVWGEQGGVLEPTGETEPPFFGSGVALSSDGNTALIGGFRDGDFTGAAWVFTRSGGTWTQQAELTGGGEVGGAQFGSSVALSANGNTALVGGLEDNSADGAAWVFTRSGSSWSAQGSKLVGDCTSSCTGPNGTGESGEGNFASSVALSGDGNTALIGAENDAGGNGAAWVFARSSTGVWSQLGSKLTPSDGVPPSDFGGSVALSTDGTVALIGGPIDNGGAGGAWVFVPSSGFWTQQGSELTPTGSSPPSNFGWSVALAGDGTALIGGEWDNGQAGAAWTFTQSSGTWEQQGSTLVPDDETGKGRFGTSVAFSADASTALIGAPNDSGGFGAAWVFAPPSPICSTLAASTPAGGGPANVSLSCTGPPGATLHYAVVSGPAHGSVGPVNQTTGQLTYTSQRGFIGQDTFTYQVSDQWGASNTAKVTITVPPPAAPVCSDVSATLARGATSVTLSLPCQAPTRVPLSYAIVTPPDQGTLGVLDQTTGRVTYSARAAYSGTDRFTYDATDPGGASNTATATITIPAPKHLNPIMTWRFAVSARYTLVESLIIKGVPAGAKVELKCSGKHCPIKSSTTTVSHRACTNKAKKRRCRSGRTSHSGTISLTGRVSRRHFRVGARLIVSTVEPGAVGKQYTFRFRPARAPAIGIAFLSPGTTRPCRRC